MADRNAEAVGRTTAGPFVKDGAAARGDAAAGREQLARRMRRRGKPARFSWLVPTIYIVFLLLPIYWLVNMSFKTNAEILTTFTLWPQEPTLRNYMVIFTDASWYSGYINSIIYVVLNMIISVTVALPAAYAFSRYRFLGDKHLFFWLLTNRMAPPAVFALPFFQLYSAFGLIDTHIAVALAHCLFNVPLAVWILEGFMSGIPKEIDETAYIDGYSWPHFFVKIFMPLIASGVGVAAFFCFMFSWVELLIARTLTTTDAKPIARAPIDGSGTLTCVKYLPMLPRASFASASADMRGRGVLAVLSMKGAR